MGARRKGPVMIKERPSVFVVDDEPVIAETLATILQQSGFEAIFFTNPQEALKAAGTKTPDLLLSDVMMPQLSGIDLAISIQGSHPECKILLFSGQAQTEDLLASARKQGYEFRLLTKPVHPGVLLRLIREQNPAWALGA